MNKTIPLLSIRNLIRQRRKNLLLGSAIAFGTMTLIIATSFVNGITDTLFNRVIVYMTGHIELNMSENGSQRFSVHRRPDYMRQLIRTHVHGIRQINENVTAFTRGIGNGKSDNLLIVGVPTDNATRFAQYKVLSGDMALFNSPAVKHPIILSEPKAKYLRVTANDMVRVRLRTINGQQQTAIFQVVAIVKSTNMFLDMASYARLADLKDTLGYRPNESGSLQIILDHPKTARSQADALHHALSSEPAWIHGSVGASSVWVTSFQKDADAIASLNTKIKLTDGERSINKKTVLLGRKFAQEHTISVGSMITVSFPQRHTSENGTMDLVVTGLYEPVTDEISESIILTHPDLFFSTYYDNHPDRPDSPPRCAPLMPLLVPEWTLLPRSHSNDELQKKLQDLGRQKLKNAVLDVRTMEETASMVLTFDAALRIITYGAVSLLFVIILIGIINSLRMNIKERTREIGTMRAIGMRQHDILALFLYESLFLATAGSITGYIIALVVMSGLSLIPVVTSTPMGIFLVDHHLYFLTHWDTVVMNLSIIICVTVAATYFPARQAATLECAAALGHSEG